MPLITPSQGTGNGRGLAGTHFQTILTNRPLGRVTAAVDACGMCVAVGGIQGRSHTGPLLQVDLIVVGSSCVTREGARLGKGEGFAELEYGILRWMGAVDDSTLVVTTVHDSQLLPSEEIPREKLLEHDVPVDVIVTPTQVVLVTSHQSP